MIKKLCKVFLIIIVLFSFSSCNMLSDKESDNSLDKVKSSRKLVIGMLYDLAPMGVLNPDTGEAYGFDVDIANELCSRMGVKAEFVYLPWNLDGEDALSNSKADCIINGFDNITERQDYYALSVPYINNRKVFMTSTNESINVPYDLGGKVLGVHVGSSCERVLNNNSNENFRDSLGSIISFENYDEAIKMLEKNQMDSILIDELLARYYKSNQPEKFKFLVDQKGEIVYAFDVQCVVAVRRKALNLRTEINRLLLEMSDDGTLSDLSVKWFGEDITVIK